ncbi:MAG: archaeosortase/exosortase family protein, partial [Thermodesulfobacteriota bacterium]|nr:archaeosortase/exosortase family protein [Thermodesulfobacteriota bacterium]
MKNHYPFISKKRILISGSIIFVVCCWILLYVRPIADLLKRWDSGDNTYCYLVPLIVIYLAFQNRTKLLQCVKSPHGVGYIGLILTGLLFILGRMGSLETIVYFSIWMSLISMLVLFWGFSFLRALAFPLVVLVFAIPL